MPGKRLKPKGIGNRGTSYLIDKITTCGDEQPSSDYVSEVIQSCWYVWGKIFFC